LLFGAHPYLPRERVRAIVGGAHDFMTIHQQLEGAHRVPLPALEDRGSSLRELAIAATDAQATKRPAPAKLVAALSQQLSDANDVDVETVLAGMFARTLPDAWNAARVTREELALLRGASVPALEVQELDLEPHLLWVADVLPDGLGRPRPTRRATIPRALPSLPGAPVV
jgi:hypothetical protein